MEDRNRLPSKYPSFGALSKGPADPRVQRIRETVLDYGPWTHAHAAELFAQWHLDTLRYSRQTKEWYASDGLHWEGDAQEKIKRWIEDFLVAYGEAVLVEFGGETGAREQRRIAGPGFRHAVWSYFSVKQEFFYDAPPMAAEMRGAK